MAGCLLNFFSTKGFSELVLQFSPFSVSFFCSVFLPSLVLKGQFIKVTTFHLTHHYRITLSKIVKSFIFGSMRVSSVVLNKTNKSQVFRVLKVLRVQRHRLLIHFWIHQINVYNVILDMNLGQNVRLYLFSSLFVFHTMS